MVEEIMKHKEFFGVEPIIIGLFWNDPESVVDGIINAMKINKPYNEEKLLSKKELIAFKDGNLLF